MTEKEQNESIENALANVDRKRRAFLRKILIGSAAAAALPLMSSTSFAAEPNQRRGKGKGGQNGGGKGKGNRSGGGKGKGNRNGSGKGSGNGEGCEGKGKGKGNRSGKGKGKGKGKGEE